MPRESPASILIIESDPGIAALLEERLTHAGLTVHLAGSPEGIGDTAARQAIDLVILDPRVDAQSAPGELLKRVRAMGIAAPAILLVMAASEEAQAEASRCGFVRCVSRSLETLGRLAEIVSEALALEVARREVEEAGTLLSTLLTLSGDAVILVGPDGRVATFDAVAETIFGCRTAEALGAPIDRFAPEPTQGRPLAADGSYDAPVMRADGSMGQVRIARAPVRVGGQDYQLLLVRNRTASMKLVEDLQRAERLAWLACHVSEALDGCRTVHAALPRILRHVGEALQAQVGGLWWLDPSSGTLVAGNTWASDRFQGNAYRSTLQGLTFPQASPLVRTFCGELQSAGALDLFRDHSFPRSIDAIRAGLQSVVGFPVSCDGELRGMGLFLSHQPPEPSELAAHVLNATGSILAQYMKRKDDANALQRTQCQFLRSQKVELLGQLAGGMAHSFNNLLTIIAGYCEYILDGLDPESPMGRSVDRIQRAGQRAARLTRQLLAFSRKPTYAPRTIDLNEVVLQTEPLLARLIEENVVVQTRLDPSPARILADPDQVGQALINLVVNARDAMPGGGRVTLETQRIQLDAPAVTSSGVVPAGAYVRLAVIDTGCGMDEATRARLFEPFFTTKDARTSAGLGLSTVYGIVKSGEGVIHVDSQPGQGTAVYVYFPERPGDLPAAAVACSASARSGSETILVVDDEQEVLEMLSRALQEEGYSVLVANCGAAALELVRTATGSIDVLLTDRVMPGMSGFELSREVLALRPEVRVIHMSGYSSHSSFATGQDDRFPLLEKPFTVTALVFKIREVLASPARVEPRPY